MTYSRSVNSIFKSPYSENQTEIISPDSPSYAMYEKVAQFLIVARGRTIKEKNDLLRGLSVAREVLTTDLGGKEITLHTSDGEPINGIHFNGNLKKGIIFLHGNGCFYETSIQKSLEWLQIFKETSNGGIATPHLFVFNPRGTGKSEGITHPENVAKDILIAFEYLVYTHLIDPNDIVIIGHSMGGFFSAFGAELVQKKFPQSTINYLSDRSFRDIHTRVDSQVPNAENMHSLITATQWDKDPISALEKLKGRICIIYHKKDSIIPYNDSLHFALETMHRSRNYSCLSLTEKNLESGVYAHNRELNEEEHKKIIVEMKRMLRLPLTSEEDLLSLDVLEPNL